MEGIVALDPAGPIFSSNSENESNANKLWPSDAKAVQGLILLKNSPTQNIFNNKTKFKMSL